MHYFTIEMWKNLIRWIFGRSEIWNRRKTGEIYPEMVNNFEY